MTAQLNIPKNVSIAHIETLESYLMGVPTELFSSFFTVGDMVEENRELSIEWEAIYRANEELFQKHGLRAFDGVI